MLSPFFALAFVSPGRQRAFRTLAVAHVLTLTVAALVVLAEPDARRPLVGHVLLVAGIVEGALLLGWRLTQLPKSQALEFLLVSPLRPRRLFTAELLVGLGRLALLTLAGLPLLLWLQLEGALHPLDVVWLLAVPWAWGALAGLVLIGWAYEPVRGRRMAERLVLLLIVIYLLVGVLAAEHLRVWLAWLPGDLGDWCVGAFHAMHRYSPFASLQAALQGDPFATLPQTLVLLGLALGVCLALAARGAARLQPHFHELHYLPAVDDSGRRRAEVGERPLSWWAVKRVTRYSGAVNLYLAGGFALLYGAYLVAGPFWPAWLGRQVFVVVDGAGGVPALASALVVLAAVPAAFQYGLWDSNAQDRCRRLELLLMTELGAQDYWEAAAAAAWRRGRGYFAVALWLCAAAVVAGRLHLGQGLALAAAGVVLWGLYFALGFRAFARGRQANGLGMLLTVGLPLVAFGLVQAGWPLLAALVPPGSVYQPATGEAAWTWVPGPLLGTLLTLGLARRALGRCDAELRRWYDRHHGQKLID
jgi:hypothetical protein